MDSRIIVTAILVICIALVIAVYVMGVEVGRMTPPGRIPYY